VKGALLGPQQVTSTVRQVIDALGVKGNIALITAGWQERESLDKELKHDLGHHVTNLKLYERGEQVLAADEEYAKLHRTRQDRLRQRQDYYRLRLHHVVDAALDIVRLSAGSPFAEDEASISIENIRRLDADHLAHCKETRLEFEDRVKPLERPAIAKHRAELATVLKRASCLVVAGGHVAVLLNRARMFGLTDLLHDMTVVAWSGGAMITGERVVLFHESPPQGVGISEVLDEGLGLHHGVLALPNPRMRLKLDDKFRVEWMSRRNLPEKCVAMDHGESVKFDGERWFDASGTHWLKPDGTVSAEWAS
jgi:hypothetical protein